MKKVFKSPLLLISVVTIVIIVFFWQRVIFQPNNYLLSGAGDGYKNYFTPTWFVAYDHGIHFTGMNYPYGDHVVFTDNQPVISWIWNGIDNFLFSVSGQTVGLINLLLFISLFFCVFFLYKIMRHYGLPAYYAGGAAILIGIMNPQLDRFTGHFALGYSVFIPLVWYLLIKVKKHHYALKWIVILTAVIIFFGFIHMYYILLAVLFIMFQVLILLLKREKNRKQIVSLIISGIVPLIFIMLFMKVTDDISDRPESPYGFFKYKATFQSVFLPAHGTLKNQATKLFHLGSANAEGYAYVGVTGLLFLGIFLFVFIKRIFFKKNFTNALINLPGDLGIYFSVSVLMLLFAMTFPFNLGLEFLLDIITPLKQFRSPGRFAWAFYFVYMVVIAVTCYLLFIKIKRKRNNAAFSFIGVISVLFMADAFSSFAKHAKAIQGNMVENPFLPSNTYFSDVFKDTKYNANDFDAIVFVPSFFMGSEKLYVDRTGSSFIYGMQIAYQMGLPLVNQMMSRTSFSQTLNNVNIVSHPNIDINVEGIYSADRILLVSIDKPLKSGEKYLIDKSTFITSKERFSFYDLHIDSLRSRGLEYAANELKTIRDSLQEFSGIKGNYFAEKPLEIFYRDGFESFASKLPFMGNGSFISDEKKLLMAEIPVSITDNIWIEISFWANSTITTMAYPFIEIEFLGENDQLIKNGSVAPTQSTDVFIGWVRAAEDFELMPSIKKIRITCSSDSPVNFDELLIRHTAFNAYYDMKSDQKFIVNNYIIGS